MGAFVYIVAARHASVSKIGFTQNLRSRLSQLKSNSASAYCWFPWTSFRFETESDARKIERMVRNDPNIALHKMPGKAEFFECSPSIVRCAVEAAIEKAGLSSVSNFPCHYEDLIQVASTFPSMPTELIQEQSEAENASYWAGARDALQVVGHLDGLVIKQLEMFELTARLRFSEESKLIELWQTIVDFYRNGRGSPTRKIAEKAMLDLHRQRSSAFDDWQDKD